MTEIQLQTSAVTWLWNTYPATRRLFFHIPNGGSRNAVEGMQLKASGVVAGIPDCILIHLGLAYGFEFKTLTGTVSPEQAKVHQVWQQDGTPVYIIRTLEEFQKAIISILGQPITTQLGKEVAA
ncbi:VRR-NUC domain-containing protein [Sphingobacterium corticibacter]|uniref:VRR-NUC domain-containing protein n=1 Tax=Sphingobacterium corticibacter TaxID=2171749 RepID=A0A2T8HNG0_9SPHI|nr:VRR-NUC domain-containing protein [Sphingobacterium corticibacter]PVH26989.1 VRR-NUC domain-containing protein [Sphingobacterium corticibacter]